ncbi:DUF726-domain-containing protein [Microthyrium microscopicum]|uniref:DUF726-domain-containing protein n=1 Tax=Microthyrium microscopicum TaxID=703497 RepID=A0A6A6UTS3_9PEZI|nr:DUF726-domain-containing protein [Microthyrium microscopicum]
MFSKVFAGPRDESSQDARAADDSITSVLSKSQCIELAVLLLLCTDDMKKEINASFEVPELQDPSTGSAIDDLVSLDKAQDNEPANNSTALKQAALKRSESRKIELASPAISGLKHAANTHFDSWRAKLLRRTCDALKASPEQVKQARKQYLENKKQGDNQKREDEFRQWAIGKRSPDSASKDRSPGWTGFTEYDPVVTSLSSLEQEKRQTILNASLSLLLSLESYSAYARITMLRLTQSLGIDRDGLVNLENAMAKGLVQVASKIDGDEHVEKQASNNAASRRWKVGLATVAGGALIAVTGGLAAPLIAAGIGSVFGAVGLGAVSGLLGALAGNTLLITGLFGAYGAKMTGKMVDELAKDVEDFKFIPIEHETPDSGLDVTRHSHIPPDHTQPSKSQESNTGQQTLRVAIGVPGPLSIEHDYLYPALLFTVPGTTTFSLRWETAALLKLGVSLNTVLRTYIWETARFELLRRTLFASIAAGLWPLGLLKLGRVVDNPFNIARTRADKAGIVLAATLIAKAQGERPVTLVGWGVGARVIYACLMELSRQNAFGLVENSVLIGAPVPGSSAEWTRLRAVVTGRLVNVFSEKDLLLGFLYRANSAQMDVAGLKAVTEVQGVENLNMTDQVDTHMKYRYLTGKILDMVEFEDISKQGVIRETKEREAFDRKGQKQSVVTKQHDADREAKAVEWTVSKAAERKSTQKSAHAVDEDAEDVGKQVDLLSLVDEEKAPSLPPRKPKSQPHKSNITVEKKDIAEEAKDSPEFHDPLEAHGVDLHDKSKGKVDGSGRSHSEAKNLDLEEMDFGSDTASIHSEAMGELAYLNPEAVSDSEFEDEAVNLGGNSGINLTWEGTYSRSNSNN